jgi:hypothetical protein
MCFKDLEAGEGRRVYCVDSAILPRRRLCSYCLWCVCMILPSFCISRTHTIQNFVVCSFVCCSVPIVFNKISGLCAFRNFLRLERLKVL